MGLMGPLGQLLGTLRRAGKEDWALPVYRSVVLEDAAKVTF
jgi:hypothetical protein